MKHKFAFFIGGARDGERHMLATLPTKLEYLVTEDMLMSDHHSGRPTMLKTRRQIYRMFSGPVNPRQLSDSPYDPAIIDADVGVYFYVRSDFA